MVSVFRNMRRSGKKTVALLMAVLILLSFTITALTALATGSANAAEDNYLYIPVSLYDYRYDNQVETPGAAPDAGTRSGGFPNYLPYGRFNEQIARSGYDTPLYFGDFYNGYGSEQLTNFKYGANLANQGRDAAAAIGLVDNTLTDGRLTQNGKELPYFSREWFNENRSEGTGALNTVTFEFYSDGSWWQDTADKTKRSFVQGNTYTYTVGSNGSRTFVQTAKGASTQNTSFVINLDSSNSWKSKPEKVRLHITSADGAAVTQDVTVVSSGTQRRASYVLGNSPIYAVTGTTFADIYENVEFPFYQIQRNGVTYYEFDSSQKNLYFNGSTFNYTNNAVYDTDMWGSGKPGFFPFNNGNPSDKGKLDYGFGAKFEIPFSMTANGRIDGNDIIFEFTGDDDVWIFIDGKLVLDMGGAHGMSDGSINFRTMQSTVATGVFDGNTNDKFAMITDDYIYDFSSLVDFSDPTQTHTLTMFYMERGMWESNLKLSFNFPQTNTLTVDSNVSFEGVNSALLSDTKKAADNNAFSYSFENKGSAENGNSGLTYPESYKVVRTVEGQQTLLNKTGEAPPGWHTLMLDASKAGWTQAYAYTWKGNGRETVTKMDKDSAAGYFYCDLANDFDHVIFRNTDGVWTNENSTVNLSPGGENFFTIRDTDTSKSRWNGAWSTYSGSTPEPGDNFIPDGNNWTTVEPTVIHGLYDSFATPKTMTSRGQTLMYGQKLKYVNQFTKGSDMRLLQSEDLQQPSRAEDAAVQFNPSGKKLSDYYSTGWELLDVDGMVLGYGGSNGYVTDNLRSDSADSFNFSNLDQNNAVRSTAQTVIYTNTVKTANIAFTKNLTAQAMNSGLYNPDEEYSFKVELSSIFGGADDTFRTYPVEYTLDGVPMTAGSDGVITLKRTQEAVITGVPVGTKYKVTEINVPGYLKVESVAGDNTKSALSGTLSQLGVYGGFINGLVTAQITITKTIDELYYGADDNPAGLSGGTAITGTNIPGDTHGYEEFTAAQQSFVFKIEQFDTQDCAGAPNKTSFAVISFDKTDGLNLTKSETLSVDPTKYYRVTEDAKLAWKYDFKSLTVHDTSGKSSTDGDKAVLFGSELNPEAVFVNAKSADRHNIEGDAALATNKLTPAP